MNNAWTVALRPVGACLRISLWRREQSAIRGAVQSLLRCAQGGSPRSGASHSSFSPVPTTTAYKRCRSGAPVNCPSRIIASALTSTATRQLSASTILGSPRVRNHAKEKIETGLRFQANDLTSTDLESVFPDYEPEDLDPPFLNRLLRVLYGRMVDGTLDLPPPKDVEEELNRGYYPDTLVPDALAWLRTHFPVDEDDAIRQRLEREEAVRSGTRRDTRTPSELISRAEELGIYAPQSGRYQAPLSERQGDVHGRSELDRIREANINAAEKEEAELDKQIAEITERVTTERQTSVKQQEDTSLVPKQDQAVTTTKEVQPPNEFERWVLRARNRATSPLTLESPEITQTSLLRRLLPSLIFTLAVSLACYTLSQTWEPPRRTDRFLQNTSLSYATVFGIFAVNIIVWTAWKFPPAWVLLNRYFVAIPAKPRAFSMLGNIFSHQSVWHLLQNSLWIFLLGVSLHEDMGRGTFLGLFIASGTIGSFSSMAWFLGRGVMGTSSMGASGAVAGLIGAWGAVHAHDFLTIPFLPEDWQEYTKVPGWVVLAVMVLGDLVRFVRPLKVTDYASHLAGFAVGGLSGWIWRRERQQEGKWKGADAIGVERPATLMERWIGWGGGTVDEETGDR